MTHTVEYDRHTPRHAVPGPLTSGSGTADTAVPDTRRTVGGGAVALLALIFIAMAAVGIAGGWATYHNMKSALGDSDMAVGLVAAGEGVVAVLGLTLIALTLIARPYPLPFRLGLWIMPVLGSAVGIYLAHDGAHRVVYAVTPLAMTAAAELAGYVARSIVVHRTGQDAEADRRTGELLRRIEFHTARAQHHPDEATRKESATAAWKLAERLGRGDFRLTTALTDGYAERTTASALAALDGLYGRTPAQAGPQPLPAPQPVPAILATPEPTPDRTEVPAPVDQVVPEPRPVPEPVREEIPGQLPFDTVDTGTGTAADTADTEEEPAQRSAPQPGVQLSDIELDAVVHMIRTATNPPSSFRDMEARFRQLGFVGSADRVRAAWKRVTADDPTALEV
ncbi:hypothetical protein ACFV1W_37205 [Kitasatospora sp. NPDC059648]|uniref:hypothetical protein n=1 Tax=Kitasatospora sp. NPDC059648 TaxID=3346894 RepID=UPI0036BD410F